MAAGTTPAASSPPPTAGVLRTIALAMAAALVGLVAVAIAMRPAAGGALPPVAAWIIGSLAIGNLVVGSLLAATADPASAGYATRLLVSLALREACGLLGAILTLLGGDVAWALGLGGAAVISLLALRPGATA